ncbi:nicalin [Adelges cooleyi]|uniref:nicalin n=1 Tax=Adelges cooleyi TaxID=133065 RepID=UPI00217FFB14|nr:nicalin [Adelges cooleyi]
MLGESNEFTEILKTGFPMYLLIALPLLLIMSPVCPANAAHEFTVNRAQQYSLQGASYGSKSSIINLEARSLKTWSNRSRHCVFVLMDNFTSEEYGQITAGTGALVLVLPPAPYTQEQQDKILEIEQTVLTSDTGIPVYILTWSNKVESLMKNIADSKIIDTTSGSIARAFIDSVTANAFQIVVTANKPILQENVAISTIQGQLIGFGFREKLPSILIVAHYDSFGLAPELSYGADSNGSGAAILLLLAKVLSKVYAEKYRPKYNIMFILSGGGKLNYLGSKNWIEQQFEKSNTLQDVSFVLCLDSLGSDKTIHAHVSKPPKDDTKTGSFINELNKNLGENRLKIVHKKINLGSDTLAWEHERYSIRRLPAFTLSSLKTHKNNARRSILDTSSTIDPKIVYRNAQVIAKALVSHIYDNNTIDAPKVTIDYETLRSTLDLLTLQPRSTQLIAQKTNPLVDDLLTIMSKYLKDVNVSHLTADKVDPQFSFHTVTKATLHVYRVKPALFDLIYTIAILLYLTLVYYFIQFVPIVYGWYAGTVKMEPVVVAPKKNVRKEKYK